MKTLKFEVNVTKRGLLKFAGLLAFIMVLMFASFSAGVGVTFNFAKKEGYETALNDVHGILAQKNIDLEWEDLGNGKYLLKVISAGDGGFQSQMLVEFHLLVEHFDAFGNLVSWTYHPMTTTNYGKDWVEQQLFTDVNYTNNALWLATSNNVTAVDPAWVELPDEEVNYGLLRVAGAYDDDGVGAANVTKTFSITGTVSSCLYGIYAADRDTIVGSLIAAEQQGVGNRKNMNAGDSLKLTVQWSIADA